MTQMTIDDLDDLEEIDTTTNNHDDTPTSTDGRTIVLYARQHYSDGGDDIKDQLKDTIKYVRKEIGIEIGDTATELMRVVDNDDPTATIHDNDTGISITATIDTRETHPDRVNNMLSAISRENIDDIVIQRLDDSADTPDNIDLVLRGCNAYVTTVHATEDALEIPPGPEGDDIRAAVAATARSHSTPDRDTYTTNEANDLNNDDSGTHDPHHGRPPIGYDVEEGELVKNENYTDIHWALTYLSKGNISIGEAARRAGASRRTIKRARNKKDLYNISD